MNELLQYCLFLITYGIGFLAGYLASHNSHKIEIVSQAKKKLTEKTAELTKQEMPTGQIKPKSAQEEFIKTLPIKKQEGLQEMKHTLDMIPELRKQKELMDRMKKEGVYEASR